jgi:hypothetical protein
MNQKRHTAAIAIKGKTQARIIFTNMGCVAMLLSRTKQSTESNTSVLLAIKEIASKNFLRLSSQDRSYEAARVRI